MASVTKHMFYDLCSTFPDIYAKMHERCKSYDDPWKEFKVLMLKQIDYFEHRDQAFFNDIFSHMMEEFFDKGSEIIQNGEQCSQIMFVV